MLPTATRNAALPAASPSLNFLKAALASAELLIPHNTLPWRGRNRQSSNLWLHIRPRLLLAHVACDVGVAEAPSLVANPLTRPVMCNITGFLSPSFADDVVLLLVRAPIPVAAPRLGACPNDGPGRLVNPPCCTR